MKVLFQGLTTALVTPFRDGVIDFASLENLIDYQRNNSIKTLLIAGSTGEVLSLNIDEYATLMTKAVESGLKIIAGCCTSNTNIAISMAHIAEKAGVHGLMLSVPSYNKPTQKGLVQHFQAIHDVTNLPIMIYSNPGRSGIDVSDETIYQLIALDRVCALKDSSGDIERPIRILSQAPNFSIIAGDDSYALALYAHGATGLISVASNIAPNLMNELVALAQNARFSEALELQKRLIILYKALFIESNPIAVKYAASLMNLCSEEMRLPLCSLGDSNQSVVKNIMQKFDLI